MDLSFRIYVNNTFGINYDDIKDNLELAAIQDLHDKSKRVPRDIEARARRLLYTLDSQGKTLAKNYFSTYKFKDLTKVPEEFLDFAEPGKGKVKLSLLDNNELIIRDHQMETRIDTIIIPIPDNKALLEAFPDIDTKKDTYFALTSFLGLLAFLKIAQAATVDHDSLKTIMDLLKENTGLILLIKLPRIE